MRIELIAGPDAGRYVELEAGAHLLGRAPHCALNVDDPALEAHHVLIEIGEDGAVEVTQLAGRTPVTVDGTSADGRTAVGRVVEVGHSRLELASKATPADPSPVAPLALAVCPDPVTTLKDAARLRRDLHLHRAAGSSVSLGVGTIRLPIELVDSAGEFPVSVELQALLTRAEWHDGLPVLVDPDRHAVIGLVDDHPGHPRAQAIARSIAHQTRSGHQLAPGCQQIGDQNPIVLAAPGDPALEHCTALLEIGARWRARWTPDVGRPDEFVRLHAAGRAGQPGCSSPRR